MGWRVPGLFGNFLLISITSSVESVGTGLSASPGLANGRDSVIIDLGPAAHGHTCAPGDVNDLLMDDVALC